MWRCAYAAMADSEDATGAPRAKRTAEEAEIVEANRAKGTYSV